MNVLSIIEALGGGGAEVAMVDLVTALDEHRHVVWHFTRSNGKRLNRNHARRLAARGIPVRDVHWRAVADAAVREHSLAGFRPDVVMFHWWRNEPWAPWLVEANDDPHRPLFVCVMHSSRATLACDYDRLVIVDDSQRRLIRTGATDRVRLIPNAVDLARYRAASRASVSKPGESFVVGSLAGLRREKMPSDFVARAVSWNVPEAEWRLAGGGPLRVEFEEQARAARPGQFLFLGHIARRAVPTFLRGLDVLCHMVAPGVHDTNPIAVMEALAAGVPVVAEARGGLPNLIEHDTNGLLGRDADEVGALLRQLANNRDQVRRLAAGARASAQRFDRAFQLAAYRQLLSALDQRAASPSPRYQLEAAL